MADRINLLDEALKHLTENDKQEVVDAVMEMVPDFIEMVLAPKLKPCRCIVFDLLQRFSSDEIKTFMKVAAVFGANTIDNTLPEELPPDFRKDFEEMKKEADAEFAVWASKYSHCRYELERRESEF